LIIQEGRKRHGDPSLPANSAINLFIVALDVRDYATANHAAPPPANAPTTKTAIE
jgi:hypothetical protein